LLHDAWNSKQRVRNNESIKTFLAHFDSVPFDQRCTQIYADICAKASKAGTRSLDPLAYMTAAIVIAQNGTLVTSRYKLYTKIKGLRMENWAEIELEAL
jgi:tRNA(fMet)-specific endonuclease VapC